MPVVSWYNNYMQIYQNSFQYRQSELHISNLHMTHTYKLRQREIASGHLRSTLVLEIAGWSSYWLLDPTLLDSSEDRGPLLLLQAEDAQQAGMSC